MNIQLDLVSHCSHGLVLHPKLQLQKFQLVQTMVKKFMFTVVLNLHGRVLIKGCDVF